MSVLLNEERIKRLGNVLALVPRHAVDVIELNDPQYTAVKKILNVCGESGVALVVANALVSYRLSLQGEKYWAEFAEYVVTNGCSRDIYSFMKGFLGQSKGNKMMREQKISRIRKASSLLSAIYMEPDKYRDLWLLVESISRSLGAKPVEKTIVFAAKMAYYAFKALGIEVKNADKIPLPVDRRVALLSSTSGIVEAPPDTIFQRLRGLAAKAWGKVSLISGIPSINLDALIWLPAQGIERYIRIGLETARDEYSKRLVDYSKGLISWQLAREIAKEILYKDPFAKKPRT